MGKIILEFDSIEEAEDAREALNASNYKMVLWDLDQLFRSTVKYGKSILNPNKEATSEEVEIAEKYREELQDLMQHYKVTLE